MNRPTTPLLATDVIVRCRGHDTAHDHLLLIERRNPPRGLALPGGFVEIGESVEQAAKRELHEETGLDVALEGLLGVYSDPGRDPRGHCVSVVFWGNADNQRPQAGDDAAAVHLVPTTAIPFERLVFDHAKIVRDYLNKP